MPFHTTVKWITAPCAAACLVVATPHLLAADGVPGDFDFYVLALSWSPTYCLVEDNSRRSQCRAEAHSFIVHGLWPQYERGYPEYCRNASSHWVPDSIVDSMSDIMPSGGLVGSGWRKHGTCSGLEQADYFDLVREAYEKIEIPKQFLSPETDQSPTPDEIEAEFVDANPGLSSGGIAVTCKNNALSEVRICLTKDIEFRTCQEVNRDGCRASQISVPAVE